MFALYLSAGIPSYAYFEVLGIRLPTSVEEIGQDVRNTIANFKAGGLPEAPAQTRRDTLYKLEIKLGEKDINERVDKFLRQKNLPERYRVQSVNIDLLSNAATAYVDFAGGQKVIANFLVVDNGKNVQLANLANASEKRFTNIELRLMRIAVNTGITNIWNYLPVARQDFDHMEVNNDHATIYMNNEIRK